MKNSFPRNAGDEEGLSILVGFPTNFALTTHSMNKYVYSSSVTATCPVHNVEMRLTSREELPADQKYYLCPRWGCVQRYRERDGYFTTLQLVEKLKTQPERICIITNNASDGF